MNYDSFQQLEEILEDNKGKADIKAVITVDLFGLPANYKKLKTISNKYNIKIIADSAQSFGASINYKKVGNLAPITCTSFFPAKPLGCYGDGGAIFTNNKIISISILFIFNCGFIHKFFNNLISNYFNSLKIF